MDKKMIRESRELLGTEVLVFAEDGSLIRKAFAEAKRIEEKFSRFKDDNELARFNSNLGEWQKMDTEFLDLLRFGGKLKEISGGCFDLCVNSFLEAMGYDNEYSFKQKGKGNHGTIELKEDGKVRITAPVDFGAIGKGYAIDKMVDILKAERRFLINAGGDIFARKWKTYFENPINEEEVIGEVEVDDFALACSNARKRKWPGGHHLLDMSSGKNANDMLAVYTQANSAMEADGFCTALFVMGYEAARELSQDLELGVMLVSSDGKLWKNTNFKGELYR